MQPQMFFIWTAIAIVQIILFTIFLFKRNNTEESVDIMPVVNYNNMTYWKDGNNLYKERIEKVTLNKLHAEKVDHLDSGLNPSELIYIIDLLEDRT